MWWRPLRSVPTAAAATALALVAACQPAPTVARTNTAGVDDAKVAGRHGALFAEVTRVRGLPLRRPVDVREVDDDELVQVLERASLRSTGRTDAEEEAFWRAFAFDEPWRDGVRNERVAGLLARLFGAGARRRLLREQYLGVYVPSERAFFVREASGAPADASTDADVMVHEAVHALQDDSFPIRVIEKIGGADARLAGHAVYEGDAVVTEWIVQGARKKKAARDVVLERGRELAATSAAGTLARLAAPTLVLSKVRALLRERMLFPYTAGARFVAAVHRRGGFSLVDDVLKHLPESTEQVIHPDKYFAGERPAVVAVPEPPPSHELVTSGVMGELHTRVLLGLRLRPEAAAQAAMGWGGDSYAIVRSKDGKIAALWSTIWDDEPSATRFARALAGASLCASTSCAPHERSFVAQRGRRVAFARGVPGPDVLDVLLQLPVTERPSAPPVSALPEPEEDEDDPEGPWRWMEVFRHERLGLSSRLPQGVEIQIGDPDIDVRVPHGGGLVFASSERFDAKSEGTLPTIFGVAVGEEIAKHGGATLEHEAAGTGSVGLLGSGPVVIWRASHGAFTARLTRLPFCKGRMTLGVYESWRDERSRALLERWKQGLEPIAGIPPVCSEGED